MYSPFTVTSISSSIAPISSLSPMTLAFTIIVTTSPASAPSEMSIATLAVELSVNASRVPGLLSSNPHPSGLFPMLP